jgi:hypothetical protein
LWVRSVRKRLDEKDMAIYGILLLDWRNMLEKSELKPCLAQLQTLVIIQLH